MMKTKAVQHTTPAMHIASTLDGIGIKVILTRHCIMVRGKPQKSGDEIGKSLYAATVMYEWM